MSPLLLMGISMVAALLMIPSDILRACKDTDALLEPSDQAGMETTPLRPRSWGFTQPGNAGLPEPGQGLG